MAIIVATRVAGNRIAVLAQSNSVVDELIVSPFGISDDFNDVEQCDAIFHLGTDGERPR